MTKPRTSRLPEPDHLHITRVDGEITKVDREHVIARDCTILINGQPFECRKFSYQEPIYRKPKKRRR